VVKNEKVGLRATLREDIYHTNPIQPAASNNASPNRTFGGTSEIISKYNSKIPETPQAQTTSQTPTDPNPDQTLSDFMGTNP
jgi:hypothetical protein